MEVFNSYMHFSLRLLPANKLCYNAPMTIDGIKQKALEHLLRYGSHPPVIYAAGTKADSVCILDDLPEDYHQSRVSLFTKGIDLATAQQIGVLRELFLASEAWVSTGRPGDKKHVAPSEDPQRTEALVVYGLDIMTKQQRLYMFTIIRDKQNIAREIRPYQGSETLEAASNPFLLTFLAGYASVALANKKHASLK